MPTRLDAKTIAEAQQDDDELSILQHNPSLKFHLLNIEGHDIYCNITNNVVRPYIPASIRREAFNTIHGLSHPSGRSTAKQLRERFVWQGVRKDALLWARQCIPCQRSKVHRTTPSHIDIPDNRFEHIHLDLIDVPKIGDFRYCLTVIDRFSRWPSLFRSKSRPTLSHQHFIHNGFVNLALRSRSTRTEDYNLNQLSFHHSLDYWEPNASGQHRTTPSLTAW
ncbi:PREDICTED: uncharacterized protein LOC108359856 [Rhagoletis zephyria]|uniref:uncharacterized protein LOC108359856 n=1 Tax=Rhagoletis zephyria TaxID=28612 RepID=UPI0008116992|nr:PREDICTED: uncharacterized protein LOC108359856 [Rhagoletis zephyria]